MKKKVLVLIGIVLFVALIAGAAILYNELKDDVENNTLYATGDEDTSDETTAENSGEANSAEGSEDESNPAPDFTVTDIDGNEVKFSDFVGKPIVLNFWASWCGPCMMEMPDFEEAYKTYKEEIQFLMVNLTDGSQETVESASAFISEKGYTFPVYYDTKMEGAMTYSVYSVPRTYFIDAEGNLEAQANTMLDAEMLQKGIDMILP